MLKNGAHVACAPCSIPSALFAQFDLTKHKPKRNSVRVRERAVLGSAPACAGRARNGDRTPPGRSIPKVEQSFSRRRPADSQGGTESAPMHRTRASKTLLRGGNQAWESTNRHRLPAILIGLHKTYYRLIEGRSPGRGRLIVRLSLTIPEVGVNFRDCPTRPSQTTFARQG